MALDAGTLHITVEFAKDLADKDWFGKQDPYCIVTVGNQTARTRTHVDGGRNPVWNETFQFNVINDNTIHLSLYDEDLVSRDDLIGSAQISCARARQLGHDHVQAPVKVKSNKQKGFVSIKLAFVANSSLKPGQPQPQGAYPGHPQPAYPQHNPYAQPPAYPTPGYPPQPFVSQPQAYAPQPQAYPPQPQAYPSGHYPPPQQQPAPQGYPSGHYPPPQHQPASSGYYPSVPTNQPQPYGYPPAGGGYPQARPASQVPYGYRS